MDNFEEMRELLRRFRWSTAEDMDDDWRETYFPPDGLRVSGITLDRRNGGFWERIDAKNNESVGTVEDLEAYLEQVQPYI